MNYIERNANQWLKIAKDRGVTLLDIREIIYAEKTPGDKVTEIQELLTLAGWSNPALERSQPQC